MICQYCGTKLFEGFCTNPACPGKLRREAMSELQPCPICKSTRICIDGGDNTYYPRCLDCGCTAPFDACQSRIPAPAEVEELLERYESSWWLLGYEAASHEDYEISEENWAKMNALKSRLLTALTTPATLAKPSREDWIKASDRMPETGKKVFAFYLNEIGKPRKIMAFYTPRFTMEQDEDPNEATEYCEDKDAYYLKEGWYEDNEFDECHWKVDGKITHWMPLPESPKEDR